MRAPLVRVIAQVRFPGILKIDNKDAVSAFQEEIRDDYPLFEQIPNQQLQIQVGSGGPAVNTVAGNIWRFQDPSKNWRVALVTESLSLEAESYTSRDDFLMRWAKVLTAVETKFNPRIALRIGVRYIDRVTDKPLETIDELVHTDILGFAKPPLRPHLRHAVSEATLTIEEGEMLLRWGILPPNATVDPNVLVPVPGLSWIIDIDVSSGEQRPFASGELSSAFRKLAERAYSVFRFMTTEKFLKTYGAAR
jgi:uncharacterized protein (TIGR04255 family)